MKIKIIIILMLLSASTLMKAQTFEPKHEISLATGGLNNSEVLDLVTSASTAIGTLGYATYDNEKFRAPIELEYFYHVTPLIGVGGVLTYLTSKRDLMYHDEKEGEMKTTYFSVLPAVKFNWLRKQNWGLYSKIALGATFGKDKMEWTTAGHDDYDENKLWFNFQASLIGAEIGSTMFRGFVELGMGEQGIVVAGARVRF